MHIREEAAERHTLSVTVDNEAGILARIAGMFSSRGYNIESLTVAETDTSEHLSRITVVTSGTLYHNASNGNALDTLSGGTFAFTDANAGAGKTVTTSGVAVNDGNSGGNYTLSYADNTTSTINRALLTFAGTVATKAYDGTTAATLAGYTLTGFAGSGASRQVGQCACLLQESLCFGQQGGSRASQGHAALGPLEQRRADIRLQSLDCLRQRRLRHVQACGRAPEVTFFGDSHEIP